MSIVTDKSQLEIVSDDCDVIHCREIDLFEKLERILDSSERKGVGLSAIQIGIPLRAFIIKLDNYVFYAMNASIVGGSDPMIWAGEGCLSDPGNYYTTDRYQYVKVEYTEYPSGIVRTREAKGLEAVVWQHEIDHTMGIMNYKRKHINAVKVGRNEPCPCGSKKKYKKCCMK